MTTFTAKAHEVQRDWYVVSAQDQVLGRLASRIATVLMGKHKPTYTPHVDTGDFVVVTDAEKINVTGNKRAEKIYQHYTLYPGGLVSETLEDLLERKPEFILRKAVERMLPKTKLGKQMLTKLKIHAGPTHPHAAQKPVPLIEVKANPS